MNAGFSLRWLEVKCHFPIFSILEEAFHYIFVIVKVPDPVQSAVPVKVHVPVIVLLFTVPCRTSVLPLGVPEVIVNWKLPVIFPLKFPLRTNDPVCVPPEVKQEFDVKLRFVPVTTVPLFCARDVVNEKVGVPVSVAVQFPATVFALFELPPPHAASTRPSARTIAIPNCFITAPFGYPSSNPCHAQKSRPIEMREHKLADVSFRTPSPEIQ
jgi:hypothetical protein